MAMSGGKDDGAPMMEMNMTPLIDVLLVLLIMFIISIPVATNALNINLPSGDPPPQDIIIEPIKNKLFITEENQVLWNATPLAVADLPNTLQAMNQVEPTPQLQFEPAPGANYDFTVKVLNIVKQNNVQNFGFVGNERYRVFGTQAGAE